MKQYVENAFDIKTAFASMQTGLTANSNFSDYIYVLNSDLKSLNKAKADQLKAVIYKIIIEHKAQYSRGKEQTTGAITTEPIIFAFAPQFWNNLFTNQIKEYDPRKQLKNLPQFKRNHYKYNISMLIQVKKQKRDEGKGSFRKRNKITQKILQVLRSQGLNPKIIQGQARESCGVTNAILAGHYNDNIEKPKDPYTFFINCLAGDQDPKNIGSSWLLAQKCDFLWDKLHSNMKNLPGILGRNDIPNSSSIFSQNHCPHAHIRLSRIKDDIGNPLNLFRESKSFTLDDYNEVQIQNAHDLIRPEQGIFFIGYQKNPAHLQKMINSQFGTQPDKFSDELLNYFTVDSGNILFVPSKTLLIQEALLSIQKGKDDQKRKTCKNQLIQVEQISGKSFKEISLYHSTQWLENYNGPQSHETIKQSTCNNYFLYSRAEYMKKMSYAQDDDPELIPPSPRILRLLSKTFALWQDTWYYDRKQKQFGHLTDFIKKYPSVIAELKTKTGYVGQISLSNYNKIPLVIRSGLAIFFNLGYVVSTEEYGCRGNINDDPKQPFGANTYHLEPEDLLAGGQANLTFGQGKHLIEYLTQDQLKAQWMKGVSLSSHSGVGHVNPNMEEIMKFGLKAMTERFQTAANKQKGKAGDNNYNLFLSTVFTLLGMEKYFRNYAKLALELANKCQPSEKQSIDSFKAINKSMNNLAEKPPSNLVEGAQLILSVFICLHLTGEPVSLGRLDYTLRKFAQPIKDKNFTISELEQDVIDCFWIKVGEKANFNKVFFEDHQRWGNLAMGGSSAPYPQGASFNQWGHQITIGGTIYDSTNTNLPFYNSITIAALRASRRIPVNAPCLGLRVQKLTPAFIIQEAAKTILAGGAHPILINDEKVISGLRKCGDYKICKDTWDKLAVVVDGQVRDVPYENWNPKIKDEHVYDFGSDGCHEFLPVGNSWFWLGGGNTLQPLEYVLNVGKSLVSAGPRFIHGKREHYKWIELSKYKDYKELQEEYFNNFEELMSKGFFFELSGFENLTPICPAPLLNAFTTDMLKRASDFYQNGTNYKIFCPQYTGLANLVNSLWNIKKLVFEEGKMTLQQVREVLLVNWGQDMTEPFISKTLPQIQKQKLFEKYTQWRVDVWNQEKFGLNREVTLFGLRIMRKMSDITRKIFEKPTENMLRLFKTLTYKYGSKEAPFGFQYLPGCGTFENFVDFGADFGASFDGRKKSQPIAEDLAPQNFLFDIDIKNDKFKWKDSYLQDILSNYSYKLGQSTQDPEWFSGAVIDFNIDEDYDIQTLKYNIKQFAQGKGTNLITISTGSRRYLEELRYDMDKDLMRFRQGGWSQFGIAMFPDLLEHHIRRRRSVAKPVFQNSTKPSVEKCKRPSQSEPLGKAQKKVKYSAKR